MVWVIQNTWENASCCHCLVYNQKKIVIKIGKKLFKYNSRYIIINLPSAA